MFLESQIPDAYSSTYPQGITNEGYPDLWKLRGRLVLRNLGKMNKFCTTRTHFIIMMSSINNISVYVSDMLNMSHKTKRRWIKDKIIIDQLIQRYRLSFINRYGVNVCTENDRHSLCSQTATFPMSWNKLATWGAGMQPKWAAVLRRRQIQRSYGHCVCRHRLLWAAIWWARRRWRRLQFQWQFVLVVFHELL